MIKMYNNQARLRQLALGLAVSSFAACGGGTKPSSSSAMASDSSVANSSQAAVTSSSLMQSSINAVSSSAPSSMQAMSSAPSGPRVAGQPYASVAGTFPDSVALAPAKVIFRSDKSWDADGMITNVHWDFGDGATSTDFNPTHTYSAVGTYQVTLTVTDNDGLTDSESLPITVINEVSNGVAPTAAISVSTQKGAVPLAVSFDATGSDAAAGADIVSYKWDFPDQTTAYGPVVSKTFNDAYSHEVFLTVTDNNGLTSEASVTIQGVLGVPKGVPGESFQTAGNPFANSAFYVSPDIEVLQNQSLEKIDPNAEAELYSKIEFVQKMPSAVWLDRTEAIYGGMENGGRRSLAGHFDEALAQQEALAVDGVKPPMTVVIIVYNLPDRDCAALASNGLLNEVSDADGDGQPDGTGLQRYREEYINVIAQTFAQYPSLRIVAMLEPDGYPNMVTNVGGSMTATDKCNAVYEAGVYKTALQYAIGTFAEMDNVYTYIDIGHSGWLGWDNTNTDNLQRGVVAFTELVKGATQSGRLDAIKGFASNTSGYTPLREPYIAGTHATRQKLAGFYEWNRHVDELSFIDTLYRRFTSGDEVEGDGGAVRRVAGQGFPSSLGFIIDTARNGWGGPNRPTGEGVPAAKDDAKFRVDRRRHRGHWCNIADAGIGEIPQANPDPSRPYIDAYYWMKPPGESDGISDKSAVDPNEEGKSYDPMCGGEATNTTGIAADVLMDAPHAGAWFHDQFVMLINNAYPPLGTKERDASAGGAKPAIVESFDDYAAGSAPRGPWMTTTTTGNSVTVNDQMFTGLRGNSVHFSAPNEPESNDQIAMLKLDDSGVGSAASNLFGRARIFVEDNGDESDMKWTLINAEGNVDQIGQVKYRLGSVNGKLALSTDSNQRGSTCEKVSTTAVPKEAWACLEWQLNPKGDLNVWLNGDLVTDLALKSSSPGCTNQNWGAGPSAFEEFLLGVGRYRPSGQQPQRPQNEPPPPPKPAVSLYIDDVALSESRLGCGTVRP